MRIIQMFVLLGLTTLSTNIYANICPDITVGCFAHLGKSDQKWAGALYSGKKIGACWTWGSLACKPCNGLTVKEFTALCNSTFSSDTCAGNVCTAAY